MEPIDVERRKSPRYPIEARVVIHQGTGEPVSGAAVDISSSGMLVHLDRPIPFHLGEEVTVEVELPPHSGKPFSPWGIGRVVRLDGERSAIQLCAGTFSHHTITLLSEPADKYQ
jgi:hypothetical protein